MRRLVVVGDPRTWDVDLPGVEVVAARRYLTDGDEAGRRGARVYNLCRSYRYQSMGWYVSLLAEARGHRPMPDVTTIQELKAPAIARLHGEELEDLIQRSLGRLQGESFVLSIYFGRNMAKTHAALAAALFELYPAPLLRARFRRDGSWSLVGVRPIAAGEVPEAHRPFLVEAAAAYFAGHRRRRPAREARYDLAILHDPEEAFPPSDARALARFVAAGRRAALEVSLLTPDELPRLAEHDALLVRMTTSPTNAAFRFAQRAEALGMPVIDAPRDILRCMNKVYLAELFARHRIPAPATLVVHRENRADVARTLGLPCVLKQPDSAFSQGVVKVDDEAALQRSLDELLEGSDLVIGQGFVPTPFDWRIGILDGEPLYAARYHMARAHWQIARRGSDGATRFGRVEAVAREEVPPRVLRLALRAARLLGDGLYGVDLKETGRRCLVVEVNDNPNIDAGAEDGVEGKTLYDRIVGALLGRIERRRENVP